MYTMQTGTEMTKLKGKKKGLFRFFYLDEHKSCIRWRPSKKQDKAKSELSAQLASPHDKRRGARLTPVHLYS